MTGVWWLLAAGLVGVAVLAARLLHNRRRDVVVARRHDGATGADDPLVDWVAELRGTPARGIGRTAGGDGATSGGQVDGANRGGDSPPPAVVPELGSRFLAAAVPGGEAVNPGEQRTARVRRSLATRSPWPWSAGGYPGPSRPGGSAGPPVRRDARRPVGVPAPSAISLPVRPPSAADLATGAGRRARWFHSALLTGSPRRTLLLVGMAGAGIGNVLAGPVAAVAAAAYGALAARALLRRQAVRRADRARRRRLDELSGLAADLRAGLPAPVAVAGLDLTGTAGTMTADPPPVRRRGAVLDPARLLGPAADRPGAGQVDVPAGERPGASDRLGRLARAAVRLADRTGAPLAELVERIEADARSVDRGLAAAAAQSAGARATAWLLAALPLGGIALGYGIGVDPVAVLLHTPVGGACAVGAIVLQAAGLFWAERLGATPGRAG
ncbi:type II secretion system F family protein [Micromonospora deserti]|uniref:type II secretion system F family protein n=1 Tax=Micromonospora deserti TaxID=2070366 RepID=UPI001F1A4E74|nr:hypothetical protein [Micromonospora deserti]